MYDMTNAASFHNLSDWASVVRQNTSHRNPVHIALVANKSARIAESSA